MNATGLLSAWLQQYPQTIARVVDFDPSTDQLSTFDLTANNPELTADILSDADRFSQWISQKLQAEQCRYGIGGFMELRTIYDNRAQFETTGQERRNLHLGVDIWADAGTPVYAPLQGIVHSFQDNNHFGDYGPTIILEHALGEFKFYSLYGHLSREDLTGLQVGDEIQVGQEIAHFGKIHENGNWPPHLHFQLMLDMQDNWGDFPGACKPSEKEKYQQIVVDPAVVLNAGGFRL